MARQTKSGEYAYSRTAQVRGRESEGRFAVIQLDAKHTRIVKRRCDGTAPGPGELVSTSRVYDIKPTRIVATGQRGTITLPGDFRRDLGIQDGTPLEMIQESGRLVIQPLKPPLAPQSTLTLDELLEGIDLDNLHPEIETGPSVGRESW